MNSTARQSYFQLAIRIAQVLALPALILLTSAPSNAQSRRHEVALIQPNVISWHFYNIPNDFPSDPIQWGLPGDQFLAGEPHMDLVTDGIDELIVYRSDQGNNTGEWFILEHTTGQSRTSTAFGLADDHAVVGDFLGVGEDSGAVAQADLFFIVDANRNLQFDPTVDPVFDWTPARLGASDRLLAGEFGGLGSFEDVAIWRGQTANWELYFMTASGLSSTPDQLVHFGQSGDLPAVGTMSGGGSSLMVFRPSEDMLFINSPRDGYGNDDVDRMVVLIGGGAFDEAAVGLQFE